jgi:hypothetical protein
MWKPKFFNIIFYFLIKYIIFFAILAFIGNRFKSIVIDSSDNKSELLSNFLYYSLYPTIIVGLFTLVFSIALFLLMKMSRGLYFLLMYLLLLTVEYLLYTYLASPSDLMNGFYNMMIGVLLLLVFFYKYLKILISK